MSQSREITSAPRYLLRKYLALALSTSALSACGGSYQDTPGEICGKQSETKTITITSDQVREHLGCLAIKGRAPKTGYSRDQFGPGWETAAGCSTREYILDRDLTDKIRDERHCRTVRGTLVDPYSGEKIPFVRGTTTSDDIQIDHVVPLSDAWQKGGQQLPLSKRVSFANDHLNLLAVKGSINQAKSDSDAATWLPPLNSARCSYVARQVLVKEKYNLWVTDAEHDAIKSTLETCPKETFTLAN